VFVSELVSRSSRPWVAAAHAAFVLTFSAAAWAQESQAPSPEILKAVQEAQQRMQAAKAAATGGTASAPTSAGASGSIIESQQLAQPEPAVRRKGVIPAPEVSPKRHMIVGEVQVVNMSNVARIAIGDGSIVKATVVDDAQIVMLPEKEGNTTLHVWLKNGRQVTFEIAVSKQNNDKLVEDLKAWVQSIPGIRVTRIGDKIAFEGRYPNNEAKDRIEAIAKQFPQVMNLVAKKAADSDPLQMERMVLLDMRVVEVKRKALEQLGIKWATTAQGPTFATNALLYSNTPFRPGTINSAFAPVNTAHPIATYLGLATQLTSALNLLEQKGDAWTLAEPRLSCKSGGKADFEAGGEIPIVVSAGFGLVSVVYKKYGVLMHFEPEADAEGNISSKLELEVSEPDARNSNQGFVAFTKNSTKTEIALKQGEPLIIAGLLREKSEKSSDAIPVLGRLPLLSYIFGSNEKRTEQTELVIIATPRVVTPTSAESTDAVQQSLKMKEEAQAVRKSFETKPILHEGKDDTANTKE
jgi:pilus assembly protein CpaC